MTAQSQISLNPSYALAMGQLLVLYAQIDQFIMEACADPLGQARIWSPGWDWPSRSAMIVVTPRQSASG